MNRIEQRNLLNRQIEQYRNRVSKGVPTYLALRELIDRTATVASTNYVAYLEMCWRTPVA